MDFKSKIKESISTQDKQSFVKFSLLQDHSAGLIHFNLSKLLGSLAKSRATIERWASKLRKGETIYSSNFGGDRQDNELRQERIDQIKLCLDESRHWSLRTLASRTGIPKSTVQQIVSRELKMKKKLGKWVPHELTDNQKDFRVLSCKINLQLYQKTKSLLQRTLAIDETWVSLYMEPTRNQRAQYLRQGEEPEPTVHQNIHEHKCMLIMAMDINGIAFYHLLGPKETVTGDVYVKFLKDNLSKWLKGRDSRGLWLLHDNARPHKSSVVKDFLIQNGISTWNHPGYSPDISPLDFCCFGQLKERFRGIKRRNWIEFESNLAQVVKQLNKEGKMNGVERLPSKWQEIVNSEGEYI